MAWLKLKEQKTNQKRSRKERSQANQVNSAELTNNAQRLAPVDRRAGIHQKVNGGLTGRTRDGVLWSICGLGNALHEC